MTESADGVSETERQIMEATFRALCEHGYADLSIANIADEFEKSKSLLYYHYDSKDDLLAEFLGFAIEYFLADLEADTGDDPVESLHRLVDRVLPVEFEGEAADAQRALVELRVQAVTDGTFRARMTESDERFAGHVRGLLVEAAEAGAIRDVDIDRTTAHLDAALSGAMFARVTTDRPEAAAATRESLHRYIDDLRVDGRHADGNADDGHADGDHEDGSATDPE